MFMRYTHLGVGHSVSLRRITKNSLGHWSPGNVMDNVSNGDEADEESGEGYERCSDEESVSDEWFSDEEPASEDGGNEKDDSGEGDGDEWVEGGDNDLLSF